MKIIINGYSYQKPTKKQSVKLKKQGFVRCVSNDGAVWYGENRYDIAITYKHSWSL